jgi:hypothetical protein
MEFDDLFKITEFVPSRTSVATMGWRMTSDSGEQEATAGQQKHEFHRFAFDGDGDLFSIISRSAT